MSSAPTVANRPAVYRSRFFIACLWAALFPAALLAIGCTVVVLLPDRIKNIDLLRRTAGLSLILVPFFYTGVVIVTYGVARLLHLIKLLSRVTLIIANVLLSLAGGALVSWANATFKIFVVNNALLFGGTVVAGVVALTGATFVWWWRASRLPPPPPLKKRTRRRPSVKEGAEPEV